MGRISNQSKYPLDVEIRGDEYLIGTDKEDGNATKTYTVDTLKDYISDSIDTDIENQDNTIKVVRVDINNLVGKVVTRESVAKYIMDNGLTVSDIEQVVFDFYGDTSTVIVDEDDNIVVDVPIDIIDPPVDTTPTLDSSISLILSYTNLGETSVDFYWTDNGDTTIASYKLFYTNTRTGETVSYPSSGTTTDLSYSATGLDNGTTYTAYLIAYGTVSGDTKLSNTVTITTDTTYVAPTEPLIILEDKTDTTTTVSYSIDSSFGADRFELYQGGIKIYDTVNINDLTHIISGLTANTLYSYYVYAYNGVTISAKSNTLNITTDIAVEPPLSQPIITLISKTANSSELSFKVGSGYEYELNRITGWRLQYRVQGNSEWTTKDYISGNISYDLTGLNELTTYEYKVASTDGDVLSAYSTIISDTTDATFSGAEVRIKFESSTGVGAIMISKAQPSTDVKVDVTVTGTMNGSTVTALNMLTFDSGESINSGGTLVKTIPIPSTGDSIPSSGGFTINEVSVNNQTGDIKITVFIRITYSANWVSLSAPSAYIIHTQTLNLF